MIAAYFSPASIGRLYTESLSEGVSALCRHRPHTVHGGRKPCPLVSSHGRSKCCLLRASGVHCSCPRKTGCVGSWHNPTAPPPRTSRGKISKNDRRGWWCEDKALLACDPRYNKRGMHQKPACTSSTPNSHNRAPQRDVGVHLRNQHHPIGSTSGRWEDCF